VLAGACAPQQRSLRWGSGAHAPRGAADAAARLTLPLPCARPPRPPPSVTLNISNVMPLPVNLSIDAAPLDANLYRPLVKVWGGKVAELDGTPTETRNYDEVASRTQYNWIAR
jgi:hypothetical protein